MNTKALDFNELGLIVLRVGDHDDMHRWGGQIHRNVPGRPVRQLQDALTAIGILDDADGIFGHGTQLALRRFRWYCDNSDYRLKVLRGSAPRAGIICPYPGTVGGVPGTCDKQVANALPEWTTGNFRTTTPLARLSLEKLSNVQTSDTFKVLDYPRSDEYEVLVHSDFASVLSTTFDGEAKKAKVTISINQTFRYADIPPSGAVVHPATKSQHLVGHAVDANIVDGDTTNTSHMFKIGKETDAADTFIDAVKKAGLRWGGDFGDYDPIHFDDFLNPDGEDYAMTYFFAQRGFDEDHPMHQVS